MKKVTSRGGTNKQVYYRIYKSPEEIDPEAIKKLLQEAVRVDTFNKNNKLKKLGKHP